MSEAGPQGTARNKGRGLTLAIAAVVLVGLAAALYVILPLSFKPATAPLASGAMTKLKPAPAAPPPSTRFVDADGKPLSLADLKGEVLVVNLWATWCGPCVHEMPTLAALQKAYAGKPVKVVAISVDAAESTDKAKAFIAKNAPLAFYQNADLKLPFALSPPAQEFPTTVIYDRSGQQRYRMTGDADWSTAEARAVVDKLLGG